MDIIFDKSFYSAVSDDDKKELDNIRNKNKSERSSVSELDTAAAATTTTGATSGDINKEIDLNEDRKSKFDLEPNIDDTEMIDTEVIQYKPIDYHWFYTSYLAEKLIWIPLSYKDSANLEKAYNENKNDIIKLRSMTELERIEYLKKNSVNYLVSIKGGRFEIDLIDLLKRPIYWEEDKKKSDVRRCLWFYKESNEQRFSPYTEDYSEFLEREYERTIKTNAFHKRIDFIKPNTALTTQPKNQIASEGSSFKLLNNKDSSTMTNEEAFVFHSNTIMLHFTQANMLDAFGNLNSDADRPQVVKRGLSEVVEKVEPDEIDKIDHLCFVVHGIGEGCDLKFRPIVDCVDDLRDIGSYILQSHLKSFIDSGEINGRVEFIPISWHNELHGDTTGVDNRLKPITLPSIPKLRQFSNSTILDVLFYTSPIYCQTIISKVGNEINRLSKIFLEKNPYFKGRISLIGHSLGSLILFDLLSHQINENDENKIEAKNLQQKPSEPISLDKFLARLNLSEYKEKFEKEKINMENIGLLSEADLIQLGIPLGHRKVLLNEFVSGTFKKERDEIQIKIKSTLESLKQNDQQMNSADYFKYGLAGTGQLSVKYPQLNFKVANFFALGSPIAMFLNVRGIDHLDTDYKFPTCDGFFNIFHPFDPVAYRFEPLLCSNPILKPVLMPHHKGRKRMHIELREGLTKVGEDLKHRMYDQIKNAWTSFTEFTKIPKVLSNNNTGAAADAAAITATTLSSTVAETTNAGANPATNSEHLESADQLESKIGETSIEDNQSRLEKEEQIPEEKIKIYLGKINKGRRIDYVLQERPIESFNEYIFALASHACYWESEDSLLLIIKEIYGHANTVDANTELNLTDKQQELSSWITQAATSAISTNVQKTISYFSFGLPQSLTSVLSSSATNTTSFLAGSSTTNKTQNPTDSTKN